MTSGLMLRAGQGNSFGQRVDGLKPLYAAQRVSRTYSFGHAEPPVEANFGRRRVVKMQRGSSGSPLLKLSEVREILRIQDRTLRAWIASGKLQVVRLSSRCLRVDPRDLQELIEHRKR